MLLATWNVNGVRAREAQLLAWLAAARPAVVCLQETKATREQLSPALAELPGYACYWHSAPKGYSGVALLVARDAFASEPRFAHPAHDRESRLVTAEVDDGDGPLVLASLYMPNGGKDYPAKVAFMGAMTAWVREVHAAGRRLILCGDMNVARADIDVHPKLRDPRVIGQSPEERALFAAMLAEGLVDVQRSQSPDDATLFTWWPYWRQHRERNIGWRLDYVLVSSALAARVGDCAVARDVGTSDHAPVVATLAARA
ncbi:MAG: exodeoxyribonuclease III [Myxococcota bacterium]